MDAGQDNLILHFTTFDLEQSENCNADYVEIRDGTDKAAPLIGDKWINSRNMKFAIKGQCIAIWKNFKIYFRKENMENKLHVVKRYL